MPLLSSLLRIDTYLILQIIISLWSSIALSAAVYTFSLFAPALRQPPLNFSEGDISTVAGFFVFSTFLNQAAGLLFDWKGARLTILAGCVAMTTSWLLLAHFVFVDYDEHDTSSSSSPPSFFFVTFLFALPPFTGTFIEMGGVMGNLGIFKMQSSFVIIMQKVFIGLGASIVGAVFAAFWAPDLVVSVTSTIFNTTTNATTTSTTTRPTSAPYASFANLMAVYSFATVALLAFWIEHRKDEPCPGLTSPPTGFSALYKRLMLRGEYCLYAGIVLLTGGNLLVVWTSSSSDEDGDGGKARAGRVLAMRKLVAVIAVLFPLSFLWMLQALPTNDELAAMKERFKSYFAIENKDKNEIDPTVVMTTTNNNKKELNEMEVYERRVMMADSASLPSSDEEESKAKQEDEEMMKATSPSAENEGKNYVTIDEGKFLVRKQSEINNNNNVEQLQQQAEQDDFSVESSHIDLDRVMKELKFKNKNKKVQKQEDIFDVYDLTPPSNTRDIFYNIKKPEMWMFWWVCFVVWGSCAMMYSNSSSIYRALPGTTLIPVSSPTTTTTFAPINNNHDDKSTPTAVVMMVEVPLPFSNSLNAIFVALIGVGNALGRAIAGKMIPLLRSRRESTNASGKVLHRLLLVPPVGAALASLLFLVCDGASLWLPLFSVGVSLGFCWSTVILVVKELFLLSGQMYAFLYTSGALTPFVFVLLLFKGVYRHYEEKQKEARLLQVGMYQNSSLPSSTYASSCFGHECIAIPMVVCFVLNLSAFAVAWMLCKRIEQGCFDDIAGDADAIQGSQTGEKHVIEEVKL